MHQDVVALGQALQAGYENHVAKPVEAEELAIVIATLPDGRRRTSPPSGMSRAWSLESALRRLVFELHGTCYPELSSGILTPARAKRTLPPETIRRAERTRVSTHGSGDNATGICSKWLFAFPRLVSPLCPSASFDRDASGLPTVETGHLCRACSTERYGFIA
jgi:hypothetical protein